MRFTDKEIQDSYKAYLQWQQQMSNANSDLNNAIGRLCKFKCLADSTLQRHRDMVKHNREHNENT